MSIDASGSPLAFATEGGGSWKVWDRYLLLEGEKAHHIGNICGTCSFFFRRLPGATHSVNVPGLVAQLSKGLVGVDGAVVEELSTIIPGGEYQVSLHEIAPSLTSPADPMDYFTHEGVELWGVDGPSDLPHDPKTEYYRAGTLAFAGARGLFEFVVPMFPQDRLSRETLGKYAHALEAGQRPTAVSLSVLDVKRPADWSGTPVITEHWCLAHYLIDGHHKVFAASQSERPVSLLSFLAIDQGLASQEQIATALTLLRR
jgi:hypothetical protein